MDSALTRRRARALAPYLLSAAAFPLVLLSAPARAQDTASDDDAGLAAGDIVVTATRKATALSRTPASIVAKGQQELDIQGVRSVADIAKITPSITFGQSAILYGTGQTSISIRGIDSSSGIPTTGIYIDDTPVQTRVGVSPSLSNPYPQVFDLERIEVLRGPQGTLFGSGSVGGAIRFITPRPSFDDVSIYARSELATTKHGSESYEAGVAIGAPITPGKVGLRASIWHRHDGGYLDRLDTATLQTVERDVNESDALTARVALGFQFTETLMITPSIFYQKQRIDDGSRFELAVSDRSSGDLKLSLNKRPEPRDDRFYLPAVKVELDLGAVTLISDTSYFNRETKTINDDTSLSYVFTGEITEGPLPPPGFEDYAPFTTNRTKQTAFTQELRLQDNEQNDRFNWIAGLFFQKSYVRDQYAATDERFLEIYNLGAVRRGEQPAANLTEVFLTELYQGQFSNFTRNVHRDRQYAAYAQADFEVVPRVKLTAGVRYTIAKYAFTGFGAGPVLTTDGQTDTANTTSKTFTPKFGISFQADRDNLFYATASKGVRGPGVSSPVGAQCIDDAAAIGFDPFATLNVEPDSIWSYEVGSKNRLFGGKVAVDASAYRIDWSNVQTQFALPQCTIQTALNLGTARIEGLDLSLAIKPFAGLTLGASASYIDARYTSVISGPGNTILRKSGEPFAQVAPWTVQLNGEYVHEIGGADLYGRVDFSYSSKIDQPVDVDSPLVDPTLPRPPATSQLDARIGGRFEVVDGAQVDVSLFATNITNEQPLTSLFHENPSSTFYRSGTFRPRTIGVTVALRR